MNNLFLRLAALVLLSGVPAHAALVAPSANITGGASFGPVSAAWGGALSTHFGSLSSDGAGQHPLSGTLRQLDLSVPGVRDQLSPVVSQLEQLGYDAEKFSRLDETGRRVLMNLVIPQAVGAVELKAMGLIMQSGRAETSADLNAAVSAMAQIKDSLSLYLTPKSLETLSSAYSTANERLASMRGSETSEKISRTAKELETGKDDDGKDSVSGRENESVDGSVAVARALVKELRATSNAEYGEELAAKLVKLAKDEPRQGVQTIVMSGLVAELRNTGNAEYGEILAGHIQDLALAAPFETVQVAGIQGLMQEVTYTGNREYAETLLPLAETLAVKSASAKVKGMAIAYLLKEIKTTSSADYSAELQAIIDRIGRSAGGLSKVEVPSLSEQAGKKSATVVSSPFFEISYDFAELKQAVKEHPIAAVISLLLILGMVSTMAHFAVPAVGIILAALFMVHLATKGLVMDFPIANFFQMLLIGGLFEGAAKAAAVSTGGIVAVVLAALGAGAIAQWSYKEDRPILGWFLNWIILAAVAAMFLGGPALFSVG